MQVAGKEGSLCLAKLAPAELQKFSNYKGHEAVYSFLYEKNGQPTGIELYVALHSTVKGSGLGGIRYVPYQNRAHAVEDALNLSYAMTQKITFAELPYGGAKAVLYVSPGEGSAEMNTKREDVFRWVGECVQRLSGKYIAAEDMGVTSYDLQNVSSRTSYVRGVRRSLGGEDFTSVVTAYGVYQGIRASMKFLYPHAPALCGKMFAIQGCLGKVGYNLSMMLSREGAFLFVSDIKEKQEIKDAFKRAKIPESMYRIVEPGQIHSRLSDAFVPCAIGGTINAKTISQMLCKVIAGCANNQLEHPEDDARMLYEKNILYVPDFVINAGGCVAVAYEEKGIDYVRSCVGRIYARVYELLEEAREKNISPLMCAEEKIRTKLLSRGGNE